jgi:tetratricopeptide (TPR) repeat protein
LREVCLRATPRPRYKELVESCAAAFEARPSADVATLVAEQALENGRNSDAAAWAKRAIDADPAFADAFVLLGGAEQQLGHRGEARAAYRRYLELAPRGRHAADVEALLRSL